MFTRRFWLTFLLALASIGPHATSAGVPHSPLMPAGLQEALGSGDLRLSGMGPDGDTTFTATWSDVAYNSLSNEYLVVWSGEDNSGALVNGEFEIFGQRIDAVSGAEIGADDFRISDMGPDGDLAYDAYRPAVAYNRDENEYLVVWSGDDDIAPLTEGKEEIFAQRIDAATGEEIGTNDFFVSVTYSPNPIYAIDARYPDVAYNGVDGEYLVVWAAPYAGQPLDKEISGRRVDGASGALLGDAVRISSVEPDCWDGDIGTLGVCIDMEARYPAVSFNPAGNEYLVVWEQDRWSYDPTDFEIFGQFLSAIATTIGANFQISSMCGGSTNGCYGRNPAIAFSGAAGEFLAVWDGDELESGLSPSGVEIFGQRIDASTRTTIGVDDFRISDMGPEDNGTYHADYPAAAYDTAHAEYLVIWHGTDDTAGLVRGEDEVFAQRIDARTGVELGVNDYRISTMGPDGDKTYDAMWPAVAFDMSGARFLVTWRGDDANAPLVNDEFEIFGRLLTPFALRYFVSDSAAAVVPATPRLAASER
jgi:hypothetical protein